MFLASLPRKLILAAVVAALIGSTLRATDSADSVLLAPVISPVAEPVSALLDGWRQAEAYATAHPGCEVFIGRGDSMLPLYHDRTVLVVRTVKINQLRAGMTAVFTGDKGSLVAHTLLENTINGWRAIGVGNQEADRTRVRYGNLVGVVVKAYAPARPDSVVAAQ